MKILIVGSGAKEYSIAKLISKYENTSLVFVAPGNEAIAEFANCIDIKADDTETLIEFAKANEIDLINCRIRKSYRKRYSTKI